MHSFTDLDKTLSRQPPGLGATLARIDTARGREQLWADQSPEVLLHLSGHARIASITASSAIEGVNVSDDRALKLVEGTPRFRNRNEKEFAGYRDAIDTLMGLQAYEPLSVPLVLHMHRLLFQHAGGRGGHLKADRNFIVSYENGQREVVFSPPSPEETGFLLGEVIDRYDSASKAELGHPLVLIGALIVDILAIHPVADGNGRLARLITTHELLSQGYGVARYVSLEQRIYASKNTYYHALFESQQGWHSGEHNIWPWITYLAGILAAAYEDFEQRVALAQAATGSKQDRVRDYILEQAPARFRRRDVERAMPGISPATIRLVLNELRDSQRIRVDGSGPSAGWERLEPIE